MKLSVFKNHLQEMSHINFVNTDAKIIPAHFHITEMAILRKDFIDCGGTMRVEQKIMAQLWSADDVAHRLSPDKLKSIIDIFEKKISQEDLEFQIEYQSDTIGKYDLDFHNGYFYLIATQTDCLAKDKCGITINNDANKNKCKPNSGCC